MIASCDIETSCGVKTCPGYGLSNSSQCEHAVHHKHNKIDIIGVYDGKDYHLFTEVSKFDAYVLEHKISLVFHNGKFDFKSLKSKGSAITLDHYVGDTQLLGSAIFKKVDAGYLKTYNEKRAILNEPLPPKQRHRVGTQYTLKTMAPYFLGVVPFWENPITHDDPEYNKLDCIYTYELHRKLLVLADEDGTREYYENYLIPWQKLLCEAELEGVLIDEKLLHKMYADAVRDLSVLEEKLQEKVRPCFINYRRTLEDELRKDSEQRCNNYIERRLKSSSKEAGVRERYAASLNDKIHNLPTRFNLASTDQMLHILTWAGIDTLVEKRDKETNEWLEKEGTNKYVLKRAKVNGNPFAEDILKYREKETEVSYLKQYIEACVDGRIYCTFNLTGTRTHRLSSSGPNLQNVKGVLRSPFVVASQEAYSVYTVDASQIEPRNIAYLTNAKAMIKLFQDGRDYHNYATKKFFPAETVGVDEKDIKKSHSTLRKTAKIGDLSIIYGTGKFTFQTMALVREEMFIPLDECDNMIQSFRKGMKEVFDWKKELEKQYKNGVKIRNKFGAPVTGRDENIHGTLFNAYVQGMSSQMIFHASLMAYNHFRSKGIDAKPLMWIHDEVVWRFPKGMEEYCKQTVDYYMTSYKLETPHGRVPLDVEGHVADRWTK